MERNKLIVNIDGPRGVGKTTQISMLANHFKQEGLSVHTHIGNMGCFDVTTNIRKSVACLRKGSDIVFNEGSFLRILAEDFTSGMTQSEVLEKNRNLIGLNELTRHEFRVLNIILFTEDIEFLKERIVNFNKLTNQNISIPDANKEADILKQMIGFERSMVTINADTMVVDIDKSEKIMEVRKKLVDSISAFF